MTEQKTDHRLEMSLAALRIGVMVLAAVATGFAL